MKKINKICVVTGTRAEYGLLYWLLKRLQSSTSVQLQLVVTGMHLSNEFGLTYKEIIKDGFTIDSKVDMLLSSDASSALSKSIGLGVISFSDALTKLSPDIIFVLGDRFEALAATIAATCLKIPIAHIHGGERTEGALDEAFRHSITKMSHIHFVSTEEYRKRVIQLGEAPSSVHNVGAIGIDNIVNLPLLSKKDVLSFLDLSFSEKNILITFHPCTLEDNTAEDQLLNLLSVLEELENTHFIFTKANADPNGRAINRLIDQFVLNHSDRAVSYVSLGQLRYLSLMRYMDCVVGNSSSGLTEAPALNIPTINIGDRQKGRVRVKSIIDCDTSKTQIRNAFKLLYSSDFQGCMEKFENPYGSGYVSEKIFSIISSLDASSILKKKFNDIEFDY